MNYSLNLLFLQTFWYIFQYLHCLDRSYKVWKDFTAYWKNIVLSGGCDWFYLCIIRKNYHKHDLQKKNLPCLLPEEEKNVPDRIDLSRTNNYKTTLSAVPPWIHGLIRALSRIPSYPRQDNVCLQRRRILRKMNFLSFDCALCGPFGSLFLTWFSASQALCKGIIAVISASTV